MSTPPLLSFAPRIDPEAPAWLRQHLNLIYSRINNHGQAFSLLSQKINNIKAGSSTTIQEGGSGGGGSVIPFTPSLLTVNDQSGATSYATMIGDNGALIVLSDASPIAVSLTSETPPFGCFFANQGAGTATLTPATGTISYAGNPGAASLPLLGGYGCLVGFSGTDWFALTMPIVPVGLVAVPHEFVISYDPATGIFAVAQPDFTDISGNLATSQLPSAGLSVTITTAQLTTGGTQGSMTFTAGLLTSQVQAT